MRFPLTTRSSPRPSRTTNAGRALLALALDAFATVEWNTVRVHESTLSWGNRSGWALRKSQAPIPLCDHRNIGRTATFESMELLGRQAVLERLRSALVRAAALIFGPIKLIIRIITLLICVVILYSRSPSSKYG